MHHLFFENDSYHPPPHPTPHTLTHTEASSPSLALFLYISLISMSSALLYSVFFFTAPKSKLLFFHSNTPHLYSASIALLTENSTMKEKHKEKVMLCLVAEKENGKEKHSLNLVNFNTPVNPLESL